MKSCSVEDCENKHMAKSYCRKHYTEAKRKGLLIGLKKCSVCGCDNLLLAKGYCRKHYDIWIIKGSPIARIITDLNEYVDCEDHYEIYLYNNKGEHIASAKIDSEDVERCKQYKWRFKEGYVVSGNSPLICLHKFVMNITDSSAQVDHIYSDTLDNRKSQLRVCNSAQNSQNQKFHKDNTSGERNVYWDKSRGKWMVIIEAFNVRYNFGLFTDFDQACQVAKTERKRLHKEFVRDK